MQLRLGVAQGNEPLHVGEHGVFVKLLGLNGVQGIFLHRKVQAVPVSLGEAQVLSRVPLHGGSGAGAGIAALLGGKAAVGDPQLVAVVQEGRSRHGEDPGKGQAAFALRQSGSGPGGVVVAGDEAPQTVFLGIVVLGQVVRQEPADIRAGVLGEEAPVARKVALTAPEIVVPEHGVVAVAPPVQTKVHVKAAAQGFVRVVPLGNKGGLGVLPVDGAQDVPPDLHGGKLLGAVIFDQGVGHVHPETVAAHVQPEADNILDGFPGGKGVGTVD